MRGNLLSNSGARAIACVFLIFSLLLSFIGCGSGTQAGKQTAKRGKGAAVFTLKWPDRQKSARLVPKAANWVVITISDTINGGGTVYGAPQYLQRPAMAPYVTTSTFTELPTGQFYATAQAYHADPRLPADPMQGNALQSTNSVLLTIVDNVPLQIPLTMNSTIAKLIVTVVGDSAIADRGSLTRLRKDIFNLNIQALDINNNNIITSQFTVTSGPEGIASIAQAGNMATVTLNTTLGATNITIQETESTLKSVFTLTCNASILIADTQNSRIVEIQDIGGTGFQTLSTVGYGIPYGVARDSLNRIYVTVVAGAAGRILRYNNFQDTHPVQDALTGTNQLSNPRQIAVDSSNTVYVADAGNNRVCSLNANLDSASFQSFSYATHAAMGSGLNQPWGVAINGTSIYISDTKNHRIIRTNKLSDDPMNPPM